MSESVTSVPEYAARLIRQQRTAVRKLVNDAFSEAEVESHPAAGRNSLTSWLAGRPDSDFLGGMLDVGFDNVIRLFAAIDDEAHGIEAILSSGRGLRLSPVTLQRGLIEATLVCCYLLDVKTPVKHLLRHAAYQLETVEGSRSMMIKFGADVSVEKRRDAEEAYVGARQMLEANGFELKARDGGSEYTHHLRFEGVNETVAFNATDAMNEYAKGHSYEWSLTSGAVHARGWYLPSVAGGLEDPPLSTVDENATAVAAGVLSASQALITSVAAYTGADISDIEKKTHLRMRALIATARDEAVSPLEFEEYKRRGVSDEWRIDRSRLGSSFAKSPEKWIRRKP